MQQNNQEFRQMANEINLHYYAQLQNQHVAIANGYTI
jgi:hypothetical protein